MLSAVERSILRHWRRAADFLEERGGSTAVEYTIIAGLVSIAIVASLSQISTPLQELLADIGAQFAAL